MDNSWVLDASKLQQENLDFVIVTVAKTTGSTPRNEGSKMLITDKEQFGSIGGGKLELEATKLARKMLQTQGNARELKTISLGASLGQCCGGQVTLFLEKQPSETALGAYSLGLLLQKELYLWFLTVVSLKTK